MVKTYITANDLLADSFRLAAKIHASEFRPDFLIGVWRGGTPVAIAIHEFLDYTGVECDHIAIRTSSYTGIGQQDSHVQLIGLEYLVETLRPENRVLIVDDVFDSGRSIEAVLQGIESQTGKNLPQTIRVACPWFKPLMNQTSITPDYYLHETNDWLVFPHELVGLSIGEIKSGKGDVAELLSLALAST
jgi:hypoxanthine phosphoribosyltransferase